MDLSIIIVEYYCLEDVTKCIKSVISNIQGLNYEIIVVSNSTYPEEDEEKVTKTFLHITWIFNRQNLGYAKAVNIGLRKSIGNYLLILNPDAELIDRNIPMLLKYFKETEDIGIAGPKIIDRTGKIQDSCRPFITPYMFVSRVIKRFFRGIEDEILEKGEYNSIQTVDWVSGACMLVRKKAVEKVGLMDERYFLYIEDMDWCKRFWDNGFKVVYWPDMVTQHDGTRLSSMGVGKRVFNKYVWIHFASYLKFLMKYSLKKQQNVKL